MSHRADERLPILEWSPSGVRAWVPGKKDLLSFDSVEAAARSGILPNGRVGAAVSRRHIFIKQVRLPNTAKAEAAMVLSRKLDSLLPVAGAELASDFQFMDDVTSEGRLAVLAAMKVTDLQQMKADFKAAGLKIIWICPAGLGAAQAAKTSGLEDAIVAEATDDGLAFDVIQKGHLTASRLVGTRTGAIDMSAELSRTMAAYGLSGAPILAAGGLNLPAASHSAKESTLAFLHGVVTHFELETPEDQRRKEEKKVNARRSMAALFAVATLAVGGLVWDDRDTAQQKVNAVKKESERRLKGIENSKKLFTSRLNESGSGAKVIVNVFNPAQSGADVISVAASLLPEKAWLTGVNFDRGRRVQVRGTAMNGEAVSAYVDSLSAQSRFRDVQLVFANNTKLEETPVVQFSITFHAMGNFPIADKNQKKGAKL